MLNILTLNAKEEIEIKNFFYIILILKSVSYSVLFSNLGRFHLNLGRFFSKLLDGND